MTHAAARVTGHARRALLVTAVATAVALSACGSSPSRTATRAADAAPLTSSSQSSSSTTTTTASATHTARRRAHPVAPEQTTTTATETVTATTTSIAPTAVTPRYQGPSPEGCLTATGLNRARAAHEPGVWEANAGLSAITNRMATVFLAGPLKNAQVARNYARSLTVVELAASGGDWVASAAIPSHLDRQVAQAAACMGRSGARRASR